jgi:trans-aconitate methyltransferase
MQRKGDFLSGLALNYAKGPDARLRFSEREAAMSEETSWSEENSRFFIEYARYVIPEREAQIQTICRLIPDPGQPFDVLELACGAGVLANAILERFPDCTLRGLDGSEEMLNAAR